MPDNFTLDWLRERVRLKHHKALAKYLGQRTADMVARDNESGFDVNRILREGFDPSKGWTSVPKSAISVLRRVPGTDPGLAWGIVWAAANNAGRDVIEWGTLRRALEISRARDPQWTQTCDDVLNELIVHEIMAR